MLLVVGLLLLGYMVALAAMGAVIACVLASATARGAGGFSPQRSARPTPIPRNDGAEPGLRSPVSRDSGSF